MHCPGRPAEAPPTVNGTLEMIEKAAVVLFFNDWQIHPDGVNAGGGESATMALGRAIAAMGYRVIACGNLPGGEVVRDDLEYWNFGGDYALHTVEARLREVGPYHAIAATLVHPFLLIREHTNCLSRILINHAPSPHASGLEPATVIEMIDYMLCVSHAQRSLILSPKVNSEKIRVVKNGFDPDVFRYAGPQGRDWNQLMFIGRLEPAKGIHYLLQVFAELKPEFPDLKLSIFGDESRWTEFMSHKSALIKKLPGLAFHGKVSQRELAENLQKAGLLVFPSISFETAGLAVVDAQASGCPVLAYSIGGVPEYIQEGVLGEVVHEKTPEGLREGIASLLRDRAKMIRMSEAALEKGRTRPWSVVAEEVMVYAERAANTRTNMVSARLPESFKKIKDFEALSMHDLLGAHQSASQIEVYSDTDLDRALQYVENDAWPYFVRGLRLEKSGATDNAITFYKEAARRTKPDDWQPFLRLALLHAERTEYPLAAVYAQEVLQRSPSIPLRSQLEQLVSLSRGV